MEGIIKLKQEFEINLINFLKDNKRSLGHGSSRVTYDLPDSFAAELGLAKEEYVVKIATSAGGLQQNQNEVNFLECAVNCNGFTSLIGVGRYCLIYEKVYEYIDKCAYDDNVNLESFIYNEDIDALQDYLDGFSQFNRSYNSANILMRASRELLEKNGALDSVQCGFNKDGEPKIYDFGFIDSSDDLSYSSQVGNSETLQYAFENFNNSNFDTILI